MELLVNDPPRRFIISNNPVIEMQDYGKIKLQPNEFVTFVNAGTAEHDVVAKNWGYYATGSLNKRLPEYGLDAALIVNERKLYYVLLVEKQAKDLFLKYLEETKCQLVTWLNSDALHKIEQLFINEPKHNLASCFCGNKEYKLVHHYTKIPEGEVNYFPSEIYDRRMYQCPVCQHYLNVHDYNFENFYQEKYVDMAYGDKLLERFQKIISLPSHLSDNKLRVQRILDFSKKTFKSNETRTLLDVGTGLCVFLYEMKRCGWICTAVDPDSRQAEHARKNCQVESFNKEFAHFVSENSNRKFDVITLNKVLEHTPDPVSMLKLCHELITEDSFVYIELPDGEEAFKDSIEREEFFIDHYHVFSINSLATLCNRAGFSIVSIERIREPSGKYSLYAFLKKDSIFHPASVMKK